MDLIEDLFSGKSLDEMKKESYEESKETPENMSYWLGKIMKSFNANNTKLKIPETKIIQLDFEYWDILTDGSQRDSIELNEYLKNKLGDFEKGKPVFLKTGIFSNKFEFDGIICGPSREDLGRKLHDMYYMSMMVGAYKTTEAVFREYVESVEDVPTIYQGMPLHTEFRVFYDFDKEKAVGVSNYWHPELMTEESLSRNNDYVEYKKVESKIIQEYETMKEDIVSEVERSLKGSSEMTGKWSIDIMKNGEDLWFIDMARMEYSSLVNVMDEVDWK